MATIQRTIHTRATAEQILASLRTIPQDAKSSGPIVDTMLLSCGYTLLDKIHEAFVVKMGGGTDESGEGWAPLDPKTIAYRKIGPRGGHVRNKQERARPDAPSQALTNKQRDRWYEVYRKALAQYKGNKGHAAAVAWIVLKREGATTLFQKYSGRKVTILKDQGQLEASLDPEQQSEDRIMRVNTGEVEVGTKRKGAIYHHKGIPGRLPQRRLWPKVDRWPASWWRAILHDVAEGVVELATYISTHLRPRQ